MQARSAPPIRPTAASASPAARLRVSQRPPTACRECSQRKVRCDKQTPCGRCVRLSKRCTREVVQISKSLSLHRDELKFLRSLREQLLEHGPALHDTVADIDSRVHFLEHGKSPVSTIDGSPATTVDNEGERGADTTIYSPTAIDYESSGDYSGLLIGEGEVGPVLSPTSMATSTASTTSTPTAGTAAATSVNDYAQPYTQYHDKYVHQQKQQQQPPSQSLLLADSMPAHHKTSILTASEVLAWGCCSQLCYPHRRCRCYQSRRYSELASINCDAAWVGRQAMSMSIALGVDTDVLPPTVVARQVVQFHMDHLRWHHSAFHGPTFLAQCEQFWSTGTADHPLWLALYFAVCSVSLWTLLNNAPARAAVLGPLVTFSLDEALVKRQYQAMVNTLYGENFLEHLSLYSVQAVVISSRIAHNLDRTDLNASLIAAAVRIGHGLGLHKISEPVVSAHNAQDNVGWHERIEIETGKRVWLQLVVQDRSQIPFTATYNIHPAQYMTPLPQNCNDDDMIERDSDMPTDSSYVRMLGRSAALIPPLLDGLGAMGAHKPPAEACQHIFECDRAMRASIAQAPRLLLRGDGNGTCTYNNSIKWLPIARRTLAISAAETVIMIHRPVLLDAFRSGGKAFSQTRTTCIAAAATILREHEQTMAEQTLSMWAHSAVCVTGAVVLGLELLYRTEVTGDTTLTYRQMMARAADRLRTRHCDAVAKRGAALIETLLAAEKDLALRMTQTTARTAMTSSTTTNGDSGQATAEDHQQAIINEMIGSHEVMARFLATAPLKVDNAVPDDATTPGTLAVAAVADNRPSSPMHIPTLSGAERRADGAEAANNSSMHDLLESIDPDAGQNFDSWFNNVFAPVYDPLP